MTPHTYSRLHHVDAPIIRATADLQLRLQDSGIPLALRPGMEVHPHAQLIENLLSCKAFGLGGTLPVRHVLLELSARDWPLDLLNTLYELRIPSDAHDTSVRKPGLLIAYERLRSEWGVADQAEAYITHADALWSA